MSEIFCVDAFDWKPHNKLELKNKLHFRRLFKYIYLESCEKKITIKFN